MLTDAATATQLAFLTAAFWTGVLLYRGDRPGHFVAGLALGALLAHLGWCLLHLPAVLARPWAIFDAASGFCVLFVPLGLLLAAPSAAAFATLPGALAVARAGCLAAGCCHGAAGEPIPLLEIAGLLSLHFATRRLPEHRVVPTVLLGVGLLRLLLEPWRSAPPLGAPLVAPAWIAAAGCAAGAVWWLGGRARTRRALASALLLACLGLPRPAPADEAALLVELPFLDEIPELGPVRDSHIAIDLSPDPDRPLVMLLDTGASYSMMTPRYARRMGVSVRRTKQTPYRRRTRLGRDLQFFVDTSSSDTAARGVEVGLVGGNFLERYVLEIDYEGRTVRFLDPRRIQVSEASAEPGEIVVPMRLSDLRPTLEVAFGSGSAWFLVDTGANVDLFVSEEGARERGIEPAEDGPLRLGRNLLGGDRARLQGLDRARVGPLELRDLELAIALREGSRYRRTNLAGPDGALLGNAFLRRFRVRFDYARRRIGLLPRSASAGN